MLEPERGARRPTTTMVRHLLIVAVGFRVAGLALVLAAIAELADLADTAWVMRQVPPADTGAALDIHTYGLVALIANAARAAGFALRALGGILNFILVVLAVAAVLALLFGVLLYLTGRGIGQHAAWARVMAMLISLGLALASCAVMVVMRRDNAPFAALPIGLSLYSLWVLIWRFA
jgi:hypothetical protein